jgi:hypothetical protein
VERPDRGGHIRDTASNGSRASPPREAGIGSEAAFAQYERLAAANAQVNYRKLPYRLATASAWDEPLDDPGVNVPHMTELADVVAVAIDAKASPVLRERVRALVAEARASAILPTERWR